MGDFDHNGWSTPGIQRQDPLPPTLRVPVDCSQFRTDTIVDVLYRDSSDPLVEGGDDANVRNIRMNLFPDDAADMALEPPPQATHPTDNNDLMVQETECLVALLEEQLLPPDEAIVAQVDDLMEDTTQNLPPLQVNDPKRKQQSTARTTTTTINPNNNEDNNKKQTTTTTTTTTPPPQQQRRRQQQQQTTINHENNRESKNKDD